MRRTDRSEVSSVGALLSRTKELGTEVVSAVRGRLEDHPRLVNLMILGLAVVLTKLVHERWRFIIQLLERDGLNLALGMLSLAGIMAGFVGVVVVFGLQASAPVFVRFRVEAGSSLGRNWLVLISTGFWAAGAAMLSAVAYSMDRFTVGAGALFLSTLLCLHAALRMFWLVRVLIDAVRLDDQEKSAPARTKFTSDRYTPAP